MNERLKARELARELLRSGFFGGKPASAQGAIGNAIPVEAPKGRLCFWWVPVVEKNRLEGYLTLQLDLTPLGFSRLGGNVAASTWLDVATIRMRAATKAHKGEKAGDAYLSFDRSPSRIAWAVEFIGKKAKTMRTVFVAGDTVWEQTLSPHEIGGAPTS